MEHPIPEWLDRWSRAWESAEIKKERVHELLDEASAKSDWPAGCAEQLSGDFYAACMEEGAVDRLGIKPVEPKRAAVRARRSEFRAAPDVLRTACADLSTPIGCLMLHTKAFVICG